jgi:hypothetical protein
MERDRGYGCGKAIIEYTDHGCQCVIERNAVVGMACWRFLEKHGDSWTRAIVGVHDSNGPEEVNARPVCWSANERGLRRPDADLSNHGRNGPSTYARLIIVDLKEKPHLNWKTSFYLLSEHSLW